MRLDPREARAVLRCCDFAALATQSAKLAGYPFLSHVPFALDARLRPVMLLSALAEHTRNLAADPHASLMAAVPGPDPQAQPRVTLLGEVRAVEPEPALADRYCRFHPEAATWLGFGDFRFYRLEPVRIRLIAGFARAGWIEAREWGLPPLPERGEAALLDACGRSAGGWAVLGIDREGVDLRDADGVRRRHEWPRRLDDDVALQGAVSAVLERLRRGEGQHGIGASEGAPPR